uniref:IS91 family transposase n=1 Tax=Clostridium butyricum TaxID=1492 RepID=UPI00374E88C2
MHSLNKREEFTPGIVTVIHTFGKDLKWNPHVHMMVTEGGKGNITEWRHIKHFAYEALRKRWHKVLFYEIMNISGADKRMRALKNKLYKDNDKGFYVHAKTEIKSAKIAAKYVGRHVGRPAIAESRILYYDGKSVTYKYNRHEDNKEIIEKVHVYEFIKKLIIHIPEKNFKMIRYFGIYSRTKKGQNNFIKMLDDKILRLRKSLYKWEYRILAAFGVSTCNCPKCNKKMRFYDIVYGKYGSIREYLKKKILKETEQKLEEAMELYGITKGIIYGRINCICLHTVQN